MTATIDERATSTAPQFGYTLMSELRDPKALVAEAVRAEDAGFDFAVQSDHFHPWLESHGHSPFAWSVLGAVAQATDAMSLATMVTCPFGRYHPAIVAQAAATLAVLNDGRFTLGLGAGERLNEHVVGAGWPPIDVRHEQLAESIDVIRRLWSGRWVTYRGRHVTVEDARLFDLPDTPPDIYVGVSGPAGVQLALAEGTGICAIEPLAPLVQRYTDGGGAPARVWGQIPVSWDRDRDRARELARDRFRFGLPGWKVMSELPNIVNFEAATKDVTADQVAEQVPCGDDAGAVLRAVEAYVEAGFTNIALVQVGDDMDRFFDAWQRELAPELLRRRTGEPSGDGSRTAAGR